MPRKNTQQIPLVCIVPDCGVAAIPDTTYCEKHHEENKELIERQKEIEKEEKRFYTMQGEIMLTKNGNPVTHLADISVRKGYLILRLPDTVKDYIKINKEKRGEIKAKLVDCIMKEGVKGNPGLVKNLGRQEEHLYQIVDAIVKWLGNYDYMNGVREKRETVNVEEIEARAKKQANMLMLEKMPEIALRQWASTLSTALDNDMPLTELRSRMLGYL